MSADRTAWRRLVDEVVHPFRDSRSALWDLLAGSRVLAGRICAWVAAPEALKTQAERAGGIAAGVAFAGYVAHQHLAIAFPACFAAWCVAAWAVSPYRPVKPPTTRNDHESGAAGEPHPTFGHWIVRAVHDATQQGRKGIHIADLLDQLHATGLCEEWDVGRLREWCEQSGIPVRRGLNIRGVGNTYGVHVDDLTQALGMPLLDVLEALGDTPSPAAPAVPVGPPDPTPLEAPADPSPEPLPATPTADG